jgi:hypothetical protein
MAEPDDASITDPQSFNRAIETLVTSARENGVDPRGAWDVELPDGPALTVEITEVMWADSISG